MGIKTDKKTKGLLDRLSRRGPQGVDTGDLGFTGIPGAVYVPRGITSPAPLIGFAHDWAKGPRHYAETMKHLASWGFVVVAPASSRSLIPHHQRFAEELSAALENVLFSSLGPGSARADSRRLGLAGHGLGGGIAALLATQRTDIRAVAAIFPAATPPAAEAVVRCDASGLILSASGGTTSVEATELQKAWRGPVVGRRLAKAIDSGFVEAPPLLKGIGLADPDRHTQRAVRPLVTGFLLATVAGNKEFEVFASAEKTMPDTVTVTDELLAKEEDDLLTGAPSLLKLVKSFTGG